MPSSLPKNIIRSKFAHGEIIDPKLGIIKSAFGLGERGAVTELQSNVFIGADKGDKFYFTYKEVAAGKPQIINGTAIKEGKAYKVEVLDVNEELAKTLGSAGWNKEISEISTIIDTQVGGKRNRSTALFAAVNPMDAARVEIAEDLEFLEAFELSENLNNRKGDIVFKMRFSVSRKGVTEEIPEIVENAVKATLDKAPAWVTDPVNKQKYWLSDTMRLVVGAAKSIMSVGGHLNMLLKGNSGFGKTSMAEAMAAYLEYDYLRVNCAQMTDTVAWFGSHEAHEGSTMFVPSDFTKAVERGKCVIVLDEFNRLETWLHNTLFPLLDHARRTTIANREIIAAPSIVFVMTMNEGSSFSGTFIVDAALLNRIDITEIVVEPPLDVEVKIVSSRVGESAENKRVVEAVRKVRQVVGDPKNQIAADASTRTSIKVARLVKVGMELKTALILVIANNINPEDAKPVLDTINQF